MKSTILVFLVLVFASIKSAYRTAMGLDDKVEGI
jgi:hypothetical protein